MKAAARGTRITCFGASPTACAYIVCVDGDQAVAEWFEANSEFVDRRVAEMQETLAAEDMYKTFSSLSSEKRSEVLRDLDARPAQTDGDFDPGTARRGARARPRPAARRRSRRLRLPGRSPSPPPDAPPPPNEPPPPRKPPPKPPPGRPPKPPPGPPAPTVTAPSAPRESSPPAMAVAARAALRRLLAAEGRIGAGLAL